VASLNALKWLRQSIVFAKRAYYRRIWGMDIDPTCTFSLTARFDHTYPRGVHVGAETYIAFNARILTHDMTRGLYLHTRIGRHCFIGGNSLIMPGVTIGDGSIVGAGSVVTKNVPAGSMVAGNPARVLREDIVVGPFGRLPTADATKQRLIEEGAFS
jgi:acetyltransferase-like isoleucine patch superfamily enzyme